MSALRIARALGEVVKSVAFVVVLALVFARGERPPFESPARCDCCERGDEYNGYASGPTVFACPKGCACHD